MSKASWFRRLWSFVTQLVFWTPLSLLINACAIGPLVYLYQSFNGDDSMPLVNIIFLWPTMWAIAFFANKLRQRIKGHKTDEYYDAVYDEVTKYYYGSEYLGSTHNVYTKTESSNTFWGVVGIVLSFIAFPLQLVALAASFLSFFFPAIYCTVRRLPEDRYFSFGNRVLHTLFDFIIIPFKVEKNSKASLRGFLWLLFFISIPIVDFIVFAPLISIVSGFGISFGIGIIATLGLIAFFFLMLAIVINIIKYGALIIYSCSKREAYKYGTKIGRLSVITYTVLLIALLFT